MTQNRNGKQSLSRRITWQITILVVLTAVLLAVISYRSLEATYMRLYNEKAQDIVRILASKIDGDELEKYVTTGETDEYYTWLQNELSLTKSNFTGIQYLYLVWPEEDRFIYIAEGVKADDDPNDINALGDEFEYGEMEYAHFVPDVKAGMPSRDLIQGDDVGFGRTISAWAPVFDSTGRVVGMVEADCVLSELSAVARGYSLRIVGAMLLCMAAVMALLMWILRRNVTAPISKLAGLVNGYTHEPLSPTKLRYDDEMQWLADSFVEMTHRIDAYNKEITRVTAEKERISTELNVATQIQADMLPRIFPAFPGRKEFDIYATMNPAKEVGGDFYDFFLVDDDHLAMVMADVSGKGVPAALFMVIAKTLIKNRAMMGGTPSEILAYVNNQLCEGNEAGLFVTVWLAIVDLNTGKGLAANAGHEHPAIRRSNGAFELIKYRHSPAVATMEDMRFREHEFELHPGDALYVYTDGVTEATNAENVLFGEERTLDALNRNAHAATGQILKTVKQEIDTFVGDAVQFDDITMLCMEYYGKEGKKNGGADG